MVALIKRTVRTLFGGIATAYKFVRNDSILSGLAVVGILALMAKYIAPNALWTWIESSLKSIWGWFTSTHAVYGWLIILFSLIAGYTVHLLSQKYKNHKLAKAKPDFLAYTSDNFYKLTWYWTWERYMDKNFNFKYTAKIDYTQICPKCTGNLERSNYHGRIFNCINDSCDWQYTFYNDDIGTHNIDDKVLNQINIKLRTGAYKEMN